VTGQHSTVICRPAGRTALQPAGQPGAQVGGCRRQAGGAAAVPEHDTGALDVALLVRRASDGVVIERLMAGEHAFLAALAGKRSLNDATERASAIEPSFDLSGALMRHVSAGTIVAFLAPSDAS